MHGRAAAPYIMHDVYKKKAGLWGRGKCKVFYRRKFYNHENKNHHSELENCPLTICIQIKLIYGMVLRYNQICDEKLPLVKIRENKHKIEISLSQLLIIRDIRNVPIDICFADDKYDDIS